VQSTGYYFVSGCRRAKTSARRQVEPGRTWLHRLFAGCQVRMLLSFQRPPRLSREGGLPSLRRARGGRTSAPGRTADCSARGDSRAGPAGASRPLLRSGAEL